jgi:hypothetical protein
MEAIKIKSCMKVFELTLGSEVLQLTFTMLAISINHSDTPCTYWMSLNCKLIFYYLLFFGALFFLLKHNYVYVLCMDGLHYFLHNSNDYCGFMIVWFRTRTLGQCCSMSSNKSETSWLSRTVACRTNI